MRRKITSMPDIAPSRTSRRRSLPFGVDHDARFTRRLAHLLRDPAEPFRSLVVHEQRKGPKGSKSERRLIYQLALHQAKAFQGLIVLVLWRCFLAEHVALRGYKATRGFIQKWRRVGVRLSKSTLFRHQKLFQQRGLEGLFDKWNGSRSNQIPDVERRLIEEVLRCEPSAREVYCCLRAKRGLLGPAVSAATVRRIAGDLRERGAISDTRTARPRSSQRKGKAAA